VSDWIDWDHIRRVQAESAARAKVWRPYYPPAAEPWHVHLYFAMVRWARIPEHGVITGDHRGWGGWRWLYLVPFLFARWALLKLDRGWPGPTLRQTWEAATEWWPRGCCRRHRLAWWWRGPR
jgi:hypothetical protein